jgi:hypothetical protein
LYYINTKTIPTLYEKDLASTNRGGNRFLSSEMMLFHIIYILIDLFKFLE